MDLTEPGQIFEDLIIKSLYLDSPNIKTHPQRLIQATKSLFGLNLEMPNVKLIEWSSRMISSYKNVNIDDIDTSDSKILDIVSIHDIEVSLKSGNRADTIEIIEKLKKVSNKRHILEFLLEISLKQSGQSFLFIWSLYRNILFINNRGLDVVLILAMDSILSDNFEPLIKDNVDFSNEDWIYGYNFSIDFIELSSHLLEVNSASLVRDYRISPFIINLFSRRIREQTRVNDKKIIKDNSIKDIFSEGRTGVLHFINNRDIDNISKELILFLDSVRCLMKYLDKSKMQAILYQFDRNIHEFNV